jgi:hypothetical protein
VPFQRGCRGTPWARRAEVSPFFDVQRAQCQNIILQKPSFPMRPLWQTSARHTWLPVLSVPASTSTLAKRAHSQEEALVEASMEGV